MEAYQQLHNGEPAVAKIETVSRRLAGSGEHKHTSFGMVRLRMQFRFCCIIFMSVILNGAFGKFDDASMRQESWLAAL